jgi:hypothetical protein
MSRADQERRELEGTGLSYDTRLSALKKPSLISTTGRERPTPTLHRTATALCGAFAAR